MQQIGYSNLFARVFKGTTQKETLTQSNQAVYRQISAIYFLREQKRKREKKITWEKQMHYRPLLPRDLQISLKLSQILGISDHT